MHASGDLQFDTNGPAHGAYSSELSNGLFWIHMNLSEASPQVPALHSVGIVMEKISHGAKLRVVAIGSSPVAGNVANAVINSKSDADPSLQRPGTSSDDWSVDSGHVETAATPDSSVAGQFRLYANCSRCGKGGSTLHAVLTGEFKTTP